MARSKNPFIFRFQSSVLLRIYLSIFSLLFAPLIYCQDKCSDSFIYGSIGDARTLIPIFASDSASAEVCSFVFNGLLKYNSDLEIVPDLAQSYEILEDGRIILFHLRKNVF